MTDGGAKGLCENYGTGKYRPFDRLRANGFSPFVVSLSNHYARFSDIL